jgi:hypothetical protein
MKRRSSWLVVLLLLLASLLRFGGLGAQELSGDEAFAVLFAERPPGEITAEILRGGEPHPPLYWIVLHGCMVIAGDSEFSVRFPSAAASILAVALVFALARRMFGWSAGLAAAAFMAINPFQIWYAQTSRMYAISIALALSTTLVLWTALRRDRWWPWVIYSLLTAAHLYLHYYALFVALAQGIWVLVTVHRQWRRLMGFIAAVAGAALLYFPWLVRALPSIEAYQGNAESPALIPMLAHILRAFSLGETIQPRTATPFLVAFGLFFAFGLWYAARAKRREAGLLALWLFVPVAGTWIASLRQPVFSVKHVITASPPFYLFLGVGAVWMARKKPWGSRLAGLLAAICLIGSAISLRNYYVVGDYSRTAGWRQVVDYLDTRATEGDVLVQNYPDPTLSYYSRGLLPLAVLPERYGVPLEHTEQALADLTHQYTRIWFLPYPHPDWDPSGAVGQWLERHADLSDDIEPGGIHLKAYLPLHVSLEQMSPVEAQLGDGIRLLGYRLAGKPQQGGTLQLTLYWEALGPGETDYTVFTHLLGAGDALLGQMDHPPQNGAAPTSTWAAGQRLADHYEIPIRLDAPTGPARLVVGMYDPATEDRLLAVGSVDEFNRIYLIEIEIRPSP